MASLPGLSPFELLALAGYLRYHCVGSASFGESSAAEPRLTRACSTCEAERSKIGKQVSLLAEALFEY